VCPYELIEELARAQELERFRVAYKQNARGELVVALILESFPP
jgi:hypothetical protein